MYTEQSINAISPTLFVGFFAALFLGLGALVYVITRELRKTP